MRAEHFVQQAEILVGLFVERIVMEVAAFEQTIRLDTGLGMLHGQKGSDQAVAHADRTPGRSLGNQATDRLADRAAEMSSFVLCPEGREDGIQRRISRT